MLLQSHEGYINPIPALPTEWAAGSYSGLCARGAFEVSAAWKEGQLTNLLVKSMMGKPCRILINSGWNIFSSKRGPVRYSYDETSHVLSFDTQPGELYTFTRGAALHAVSAAIPQRLKLPVGEELSGSFQHQH
jgi:alpha-L-fucosidase 2